MTRKKLSKQLACYVIIAKATARVKVQKLFFHRVPFFCAALLLLVQQQQSKAVLRRRREELQRSLVNWLSAFAQQASKNLRFVHGICEINQILCFSRITMKVA